MLSLASAICCASDELRDLIFAATATSFSPRGAASCVGVGFGFRRRCRFRFRVGLRCRVRSWVYPHPSRELHRRRWGRDSLAAHCVSRDCRGAWLAPSASCVRHLLFILIALTGCIDTLETDDRGPGSAAPPASPIEYSPYFYTWGWGSGAYAFPSLMEMRQLGGPSDVTLGFVNSNGGCTVTTDIHDNLDDVQAFVAAGGHVRASFGGENGTYIETSCTDATALASELASFVDDTGITDLDFDIEQGSATSNAQINEDRAYAIRTVQDSRGVHVSFTLPVSRDGLDDLALGVLQGAQMYGVTISYVNVMTMDYGSGNDLGTTPEDSIDATAAQLEKLFGLSRDDAYRMVGATAMIGDNDDPETFSIADAGKLASYATQRELGLLSFWAIQRDQPCTGAVNIQTCNGVGTSTFQFDDIFAGAAR